MSSKVKDLYDGYKGELTALIISMNRGITAKGAPHLPFVFQGKSGSIDAKYWNVSEELLHKFQPGMLVGMSGDVLCRQRQLQFRVQQVKELEEAADISNYIKKEPYSQQVLHETVQPCIDEIENMVTKQLVYGILKDHGKGFFEYPVAMRNHHDSYAGLATHVLEMLQLVEQLCHPYSILDRGPLYSGVILHGVGKTVELSGATVSEYTAQGKPLGCISIMRAEVLTKAEQPGLEDYEEAMLLRHVILSYHGVYEYGSPVPPMIPEAKTSHMIDSVDVRMNTLCRVLEPIQVREFIRRIFALENRSFYKSRYEGSGGEWTQRHLFTTFLRHFSSL